MVLELPNVTLFVIHGGPAFDLFKHAAQVTLKRIRPQEFIIFTHDMPLWMEKGELFVDCPVRVIRIPRCYNAKQAMQIYWYRVPLEIKTPHMLHVEWDGWVVDETAWRDSFLDFDYIGAPWPWHQDEYKVGNGLGLRSTRLMNYLREHPSEFPLPELEDHTLCREYRPRLEALGFRWATLEEATQFSWERGPKPIDSTFMYHGAFNWPEVLDSTEFEKVVGLADEYIQSSVAYRELQRRGLV